MQLTATLLRTMCTNSATESTYINDSDPVSDDSESCSSDTTRSDAAIEEQRAVTSDFESDESTDISDSDPVE